MTQLNYQHTCEQLNLLKELIEKSRNAPLLQKARDAECALQCALVVFDQLNRRVGQLERDQAEATARLFEDVHARLERLEGARDGQ